MIAATGDNVQAPAVLACCEFEGTLAMSIETTYRRPRGRTNADVRCVWVYNLAVPLVSKDVVTIGTEVPRI
jgi:hypothetical protein